MTYNHLYAITFTMDQSEDPEGKLENVAPSDIRKAIMERLWNLKDDELVEAIGAPEDTYEEEWP